MARHRVRAQRRRGMLGACVLGLLIVSVPTLSHTAEPDAVAPPGPALQPPQERFLQHFISQSLGQGSAATGTPASPSPSAPQPATGGTPPAAGARQGTQLAAPLSLPSGDLTGATLKMVLSLAGILGLLLLGGYVIRRYLLAQTFLGKRTPMMRVLARVNITPKAGVALLEVPGKVLVLGITGSTLVALGELPAASSPPLEQPVTPPEVSFASTLETSMGSQHAEPRPADVLLTVSEAIQQKMRRLKHL